MSRVHLLTYFQTSSEEGRDSPLERDLFRQSFKPLGFEKRGVQPLINAQNFCSKTRKKFFYSYFETLGFVEMLSQKVLFVCLNHNDQIFFCPVNNNFDTICNTDDDE